MIYIHTIPSVSTLCHIADTSTLFFMYVSFILIITTSFYKYIQFYMVTITVNLWDPTVNTLVLHFPLL